MAKKLFLLDGMALVYRAHFALIARPIMTSKGVNTSALYGFSQTLLEILRTQEPTHVGVAFDTEAPTQRHTVFKEYKATRQEMPEDLSKAIPHVKRMLEAFRIPVLTCDGYEADDIIGTLVKHAAAEDYQCYMVTPDKDFGQLVRENVMIYKPGRMGDPAEVLGVAEILRRWSIGRTEQVVDVLALMGDSSDNIPGVPGIGEKTAVKLIGQFGSLENLLSRTSELSGKIRETLEKNRELALMSRDLATIDCNTPCDTGLDRLKLQEPDHEQLKAILIEFEFNSLGRRIYGNDFKAGRGYQEPLAPEAAPAPKAVSEQPGDAEMSRPPVRSISELPHDYRAVETEPERKKLAAELRTKKAFAFKLKSVGDGPVEDSVEGIAFSWAGHQAVYVPLSRASGSTLSFIEEMRPLWESGEVEKVGHDLKEDIRTLKDFGVELAGPVFDCNIAHSLVEPEVRHSLDYMAEVYLGVSLETEKASAQGEFEMMGSALERGRGLLQRVDVAWQLQARLRPALEEKRQKRVFYELEAPLLPVLADMEREGIRVDTRALADFSAQLSKEMEAQEREICRMAGSPFNLNSPRQLGQILFEVMKICENPKKTRTGQYATDEQTLQSFALDHPIVQRLLEYRTAAKLKSTYADALPQTVRPSTGRIHTTFNQVMTATGRLSSWNPNLQNIPIRTERGQEIRKAFVARGPEYLLLSADYSQIELRIIAALSQEKGLLEAFQNEQDVHIATAARVYGVSFEGVTAEMRRKAKMVNYGIAYGISAFGLAQRLQIPRKEATEIIDQYFKQFPRIRWYMDETIEFARKHGYVETVIGRRRYLRDINSRNATIRGSAERNAINMPIQGTAADMIKVAMIQISEALKSRKLRSRMVLQVHDELVFDLFRSEQAEVEVLVRERMQSAIPLAVPIVVEMGTGETWLDAH